MRRRRPLLAWLIPAGILAAAAYGFWQGTPSDLISAVRRGDVAAVTSHLARYPADVHTKVYPQGYETATRQREYLLRSGKSPWAGRYLIHEAADRTEHPLPMLDALAAAGADLQVRLDGRTLLHRAARSGQLDVAGWLLERGLDVDARNTCDGCPEFGQTPLHEVRAFNSDAMIALLVARGATLNAASASGRTPLHEAAQAGQLSNAFALCRYGADPTRADQEGRTPYALVRAPGVERDQLPTPEDLRLLHVWLAPDGGCARVAMLAREIGRPVSEDTAREVFAATTVR